MFNKKLYDTLTTPFGQRHRSPAISVHIIGRVADPESSPPAPRTTAVHVFLIT
mgnify:CR=1 FL=1